jgi:hypothetical protein
LDVSVDAPFNEDSAADEAEVKIGRIEMIPSHLGMELSELPGLAAVNPLARECFRDEARSESGTNGRLVDELEMGTGLLVGNGRLLTTRGLRPAPTLLTTGLAGLIFAAGRGVLPI